MSYKPQFDTGDLVVTQSKNIGIVEPSSQAEHAPGVGLIMHYRVKFGRRDRYGAIEHVWGEKLRRPKFREFIWFRNPNTGGWMFGKTRGWMAILIHLFALIIFSCGFTIEEFGWQLFTHAFGLSIIGLMWLGSWMNHTKRWV